MFVILNLNSELLSSNDELMYGEASLVNEKAFHLLCHLEISNYFVIVIIIGRLCTKYFHESTF